MWKITLSVPQGMRFKSSQEVMGSQYLSEGYATPADVLGRQNRSRSVLVNENGMGWVGME